MATKVALRQKTISKGRKSLYLDFYPPIINAETGEPTRREFLGLYLFIDKAELKKEMQSKGKSKEVIEQLQKDLKPLTSTEKKHNEETLKIAESIRQKRNNFINKPEIYSHYEKEQLRLKAAGEQNFVEYFKKLADKRKASNHDNWISAYNYLKQFTKGVLPFSKLNEQFLEDFKEYLLTTKSIKSKQMIKVTLSQNSAVSYFNKVKASMKQAYKDGILQNDLNAKISPIKAKETRREYLTIEELNNLVKTPCNNELLKRAALFSALTGLRYSDIKKLTWSEIEFVKGQGYFLKFEQEKTEGIEYLPISEQAVSLCGEVREPKSIVFDGLRYTAYHSKHLGQWLGAAGITKDITFHNFRHTFATLQLFNGTDIYTVSKMLGHKDLKTTQVYAKVVDEAKRKATGNIKLDF
ncbi:site-specific integrase [Chryseobacterium gotjawalense]|uniref:Site-specific integrase n=1 Tax=Chryseobacterium gotjawalense TaxID=3042315 RepID=A0ABY8RD11_9FLAO|nr:site-specific integrase [Chryseobacterium sp. wdc7]WHF51850.1 site-specific integrase [Chryseobacterium sp. wdc7]